MQKRLERRLKCRPEAGGWGALWFIEFQERGAPHAHLLLFSTGPRWTRRELAAFDRWLKATWAEVVGHEDPEHRRLHWRRGARAERHRAGHFGYAARFGKKHGQKRVLPGFEDAGRLWGVWNSPVRGRELASFKVDRRGLERLRRRLEGLVAANVAEAVRRPRLPAC